MITLQAHTKGEGKIVREEVGTEDGVMRGGLKSFEHNYVARGKFATVYVQVYP